MDIKTYNLYDAYTLQMGVNYQLRRTKGASQSWRRTMQPFLASLQQFADKPFIKRGNRLSQDAGFPRGNPSGKTNGKGVVIKPLSDKSLQFQTCLVMSKDDDSRLTNEFARAFLRRYAPQRVPPKQMNLPLSEAHGSERASARDA